MATAKDLIFCWFLGGLCLGFFCGLFVCFFGWLVFFKEKETLCYEQKVKDKKEGVSVLLFPAGCSL